MTGDDSCPFDPLSLDDHDHAPERLAESRARGSVDRPYPGVNVVVRDEECRAVLLDPGTYSNHFNFTLDAGPAPETRTGDYRIITRTDPPEHGPLRTFLRRWFAPRLLRRMAPQVEAIVSRALDALPTDRPVDLFHELAHVVPAQVVYRMLGLPEADWAAVQQWADEVNDALPAQNPRAVGKMRDYLSGLVDTRMATGDRHDDVIDGFLHPGAGAPPRERAEVLQHVRQLIAAGTDTSSAMLTNLLYRLLEDRSRWERVRREPGLVAPAVEESLRLDAPIQYTLRTVTSDADLAGCPVAPRDRVVVSLQSANRDERVWGPDADGYDLDRPGPAGHVSFGSGIHACLGAPLARLEGQIVLTAMLARFPRARLAPGYVWRPVRTVQIRRPATLMVVLEPADES